MIVYTLLVSFLLIVSRFPRSWVKRTAPAIIVMSDWNMKPWRRENRATIYTSCTGGHHCAWQLARGFDRSPPAKIIQRVLPKQRLVLQNLETVSVNCLFGSSGGRTYLLSSADYCRSLKHPVHTNDILVSRIGLTSSETELCPKGKGKGR